MTNPPWAPSWNQLFNEGTNPCFTTQAEAWGCFLSDYSWVSKEISTLGLWVESISPHCTVTSLTLLAWLRQQPAVMSLEELVQSPFNHCLFEPHSPKTSILAWPRPLTFRWPALKVSVWPHLPSGRMNIYIICPDSPSLSDLITLTRRSLDLCFRIVALSLGETLSCLRLKDTCVGA